jgi:hypothetical protein
MTAVRGWTAQQSFPRSPAFGASVFGPKCCRPVPCRIGPCRVGITTNFTPSHISGRFSVDAYTFSGGTMASRDRTSDAKAQASLPIYDENFLQFHAGRIISDPAVAITELVANCWDAGADRVDITWPTAIGEEIAVEDNGSGMTLAEFERRWRTLNYNRLREQGSAVEFPLGIRDRVRGAFGRNGIGRHAMFYFASEYGVRTEKDGELTEARVERSIGPTPFKLDILHHGKGRSHGTKISAVANKVPLNPDAIGELIGSKFVADPDFRIFVNRARVTLVDLEDVSAKLPLVVEGIGEFLVRRFDSERVGRTSKQHGVAWWVHRRLVGSPNWEGLTERILDARTGPAKRYTYVVEADVLAEHVKPDWTGFYASREVMEARRCVDDFILDDLRSLTKDLRRDRKRALLEQNSTTIRTLPAASQEQIAAFAEEIQVQCPNMGERELVHAVQVLTNLEKARSGYLLLEKLARLDPSDLDGLNAILDEWTVSDAQKVLGELRYRLSLIEELEKLLDREHADELHELQPVFERGLWIFGPEYDAIDFVSNRQLVTVVRKFFKQEILTTPDKRPDFVILPDRSIGVYSNDSYGPNHEVAGYGKVVIVELKKGGSVISHTEKDQAAHYAREIRRNVGRSALIEAYVLGSAVDPEAEDASTEGATTIVPRCFAVVLRQAHARTFGLLRKLQRGGEVVRDPDLKDMLSAPPELVLAE